MVRIVNTKLRSFRPCRRQHGPDSELVLSSAVCRADHSPQYGAYCEACCPARLATGELRTLLFPAWTLWTPPSLLPTTAAWISSICRIQGAGHGIIVRRDHRPLLVILSSRHQPRTTAVFARCVSDSPPQPSAINLVDYTSVPTRQMNSVNVQLFLS